MGQGFPTGCTESWLRLGPTVRMFSLPSSSSFNNTTKAATLASRTA